MSEISSEFRAQAQAVLADLVDERSALLPSAWDEIDAWLTELEGAVAAAATRGDASVLPPLMRVLVKRLPGLRTMSIGKEPDPEAPRPASSSERERVNKLVSSIAELPSPPRQLDERSPGSPQ